jgi:hypothetical protein
MPWRNGGGETIELATYPRDAKYGAFDWRVSLARMDCDAPFSVFAEVDRTISVIDGDGVDLAFGTTPLIHLTREDVLAAFTGEQNCNCHLLGGPVTALNVMVARRRFTCNVTPVRDRVWVACDGR